LIEPPTALSPPTDILQQSCKRVAMLGAALAGLLAIGLAVGNLAALLTASDGNGYAALWPLPGSAFAAVGIVLSVILAMLARRLHQRPQLLLDLSLVFQVAFAFLVGMLHYWTLPGGGLSPLTVIILIFPMIAPNSVPKILLASLVSATMDPLGFGLAALRGVESQLPTSTMLLQFLPTYAMAFVAVIPAQIVRRLGREVRQARELGSYRLGGRIGSGGMGEVYHAEHRHLARPAAIKLIRPDILGAHATGNAPVALERFRREAQAVATLRSPHTTALYDFGVTEDGRPYLVMELLDGMGLDELVERYGPLPPERAAYLVAQACASLAEAHHRGMVHRDVKPSNLFTTRQGLEFDFVKVLDFGIVKDRLGHESTTLTTPDTATGTPEYMAPEVAMGEEEIDGRVDVYALGCVLYWLVTGKPVFEASSPRRMLHLHITEPPPAPSTRTELDVPAEFDDVVLACLAKNPADRPASARELARRLAAIPFAELWTAERAQGWWETHVPGRDVRGSYDKGVVAPTVWMA
jgi:hypothetical protein